MLFLLAALLTQTQEKPVSAPTDVARMAVLYDEVCLKTFPNDVGVDALMTAKGAKPISTEDVRVSLRDDPGRGWQVNDGNQSFTVLLELSPFHACSVRASRPIMGKLDLAAYRAVVDPFIADHPGFAEQPPMDADRGGIRMHAEWQARALPSGSGELLIVIDQKVSDPAKLAPGTTATPLRFVHQIKTGN